jgi:hypothetical protein
MKKLRHQGHTLQNTEVYFEYILVPALFMLLHYNMVLKVSDSDTFFEHS